MEGNDRTYGIAVAGPGALLVAKLHKLGERQEQASRLNAKDALDVLRLLRGVSTRQLADSLHRQLEDTISAAVASEAVQYLDSLFSSEEAPGSKLAGLAVEGLEDPGVIRASAGALASDLLRAIEIAH